MVPVDLYVVVPVHVQLVIAVNVFLDVPVHFDVCIALDVQGRIAVDCDLRVPLDVDIVVLQNDQVIVLDDFRDLGSVRVYFLECALAVPCADAFRALGVVPFLNVTRFCFVNVAIGVFRVVFRGRFRPRATERDVGGVDPDALLLNDGFPDPFIT